MPILVYAQIGVNTVTPQGVFHVDSQGNTSGGINGTDDVLISSAGNVGVGIVTPTAKFDLRGDIRILDGTQQRNYVLMSDAVGVGSWTKIAYLRVISGSDANAALANFPVSAGGEGQFRDSGVRITLPAGEWQIAFTATYFNNTSSSLNIWWDLSSSPNSYVFAGRVVSYTASPGQYIATTATYMVTPTITTTYSVWATGMNFPAGASVNYGGSGKIWATPVE